MVRWSDSTPWFWTPPPDYWLAHVMWKLKALRSTGMSKMCCCHAWCSKHASEPLIDSVHWLINIQTGHPCCVNHSMGRGERGVHVFGRLGPWGVVERSGPLVAWGHRSSSTDGGTKNCPFSLFFHLSNVTESWNPVFSLDRIFPLMSIFHPWSQRLKTASRNICIGICSCQRRCLKRPLTRGIFHPSRGSSTQQLEHFHELSSSVAVNSLLSKPAPFLKPAALLLHLFLFDRHTCV